MSYEKCFSDYFKVQSSFHSLMNSFNYMNLEAITKRVCSLLRKRDVPLSPKAVAKIAPLEQFA